MSVVLHVMYRQPEDPAHFLAHYGAVHATLAGAMPHVRRFEHGPAAPNPDGTPGEWFYIATLQYDSVEDLAASMASPEGLAASADVANYARREQMSTAIVSLA